VHGFLTGSSPKRSVTGVLALTGYSHAPGAPGRGPAGRLREVSFGGTTHRGQKHRDRKGVLVMHRDRFGAALVLCGFLLAAPAGAAKPAPKRGETPEDTAAMLQRQTQQLCDAVAIGDAKVWDRFLADDMSYADENGKVKGKQELLSELKPLPKDVWGKIKVTQFQARPHGAGIVTVTYVADESEGYHGQVIKARYLETDTWQWTEGKGWKLIAAQVNALRDDPPAAKLAAEKLDEYVGTYALTPEISYTIRREGDGLVGQRSGRDPEPLKAEVADVFFVPGQPRIRKIFRRGTDGALTGFVERRETWDIVWKRNP
jgi:uncharacterized protein DUF4440